MHRILILALLCACNLAIHAQTPAKPASSTQAVMPKFTVKFGPYADSSMTLVSVAKQLLKNELKVTDSKNNAYKIRSFEFAWRKKELTDNFETGIPKTIFVYSVTEVKDDSHLPSAWQKEMNDLLQSGEEWYFNEIVIEDPKTSKIYKAPSVRLLIK